MRQVTHDYCMCEHKSHLIVLREDGTVETPDHPEAVAQGRRTAGFARLGRHVTVQGCATIAALVYGSEILCDYWTPTHVTDAPAAWKEALSTFRSHRVVAFAMTAAQAKKRAQHDAVVDRLMVELGKCSWFLGQPLDLKPGLRSEDLKGWGTVGFIDTLGLPTNQRLRIPLQSYWLDLASNGRIVYNDKLIVGDDSSDPRLVYAIHRDCDVEQQVLKVGAFRRDTRMERLERA